MSFTSLEGRELFRVNSTEASVVTEKHHLSISFPSIAFPWKREADSLKPLVRRRLVELSLDRDNFERELMMIRFPPHVVGEETRCQRSSSSEAGNVKSLFPLTLYRKVSTTRLRYNFIQGVNRFLLENMNNLGTFSDGILDNSKKH
jgi:hypothetical protein